MKKISKIFLIFIIIFNLVIAPTLATDELNLNSNDIAIADTNELNLTSEAAILMEHESSNILYQKNITEKLYPASTTKIMTAILAIENCDLKETATVSQNAINMVPSGYTNAGMVAGETFTVEDLLYALMLASANEAANALAEHISGSVDNFAVLMNEKAKELGCKNTNFLNANGMHNENHYTTAEDLCIIANYCFENETFRNIIQTVSYTIPATELHPATDRILTNTDALINSSNKYYYKYALGGKTGFTTQAGNCLVCFAKKDDIYLTCVILKANSSATRFSEAKALLEYGYENFSKQVLVPKGTEIQTIEISNGKKSENTVKLVTNEEISDFLKNNSENNLEYEVSLNENLKAPIYVGRVLGKITYTLDSKTYSTDLIAGNTVYSQANYGIYFVIAGAILLVFSIILIPKKQHIKNIEENLESSEKDNKI